MRGTAHHTHVHVPVRRDARLVLIVLLASLPLLLIASYEFEQYDRVARDHLVADQLRQAELAADIADAYVDGNFSTLRALSQLPLWRQADPATINDLIAAILRVDPNWLTLGLSDADGWNISSTSAPVHTVNVADRDYFQDVMRTRSPSVGATVIARGTLATKTAVLAVPITFMNGTVGVLSGALQFDRGARVLGNAVPPGVELHVIDRRGQEFIGSRSSADTAPIVTDRPDVAATLSSSSGARTVTVGGQDTLVTYAKPDLSGWTLILARPVAVAFEVADRERAIAATLAVGGELVALLIAWAVGRRLERSEAALDTERRRLRTALESAPANVGLLEGEDLVYTLVSERSRGNRRPSLVLGKRYRDLDPEPERNAALERVYRTGKTWESREMAVDSADGRRYFDFVAVALQDARGRTDRVLYHAVDITDAVEARIRVEELVRTITAERDDLQHLIDVLPEPILVQRVGTPLLSNRAARELFGPIADHPEDRRLNNEPRHTDGRPYASHELPLVRGQRGDEIRGEQMIVRNSVNGQDVEVLASVAPVRRGGEIVAAIGVFQDIRSLKALERQRTEFFSMASHEIKTPVTAIQLQIQLAQRSLAARQTERVAGLLAAAAERTRALVELVNDLLEVSRIESGRLAFELADTDLRSVVGEIVRTFPTDDAHPLRVTAPERPLPVRVDARRVRELLENLLANAVKYSPAGGAIDVQLSADNGVATMRVRDHGFGVPEEDRAYIFDRFFRTSRARGYGGVGLGLFISREIAQRHGGLLDLESSSEDGSTFVLRIPLVPAPMPAATA